MITSPLPPELGSQLETKPRAIVVLSGGQDSATCLFLAQRECEVVAAIHFQYGQKHEIEGRFAAQIASLANVPLFVSQVPALCDFADSALVTGGDVSQAHPKLAHLPASFVPGRNLAFLTLAAAFAMKQNATRVYTGVCQEDHAGYPDCRENTIRQLGNALRLGMDFSELEIVTPLMHLSKSQTWMLADELSVTETIIQHTHTCYNGNHTQHYPWGYGCGFCPACQTRAKGFFDWSGSTEIVAQWNVKMQESGAAKEIKIEFNAQLHVGEREMASLPKSGPLPRPNSLDEAAISLRNERIEAPDVSQIRFACEEFTSVCPRSGQPDFGTVSISCEPGEWALESKALKFYLWAFRDEGMFCEQLAARIAADVMAAIEPSSCCVTVTQNRRGGIGLVVTAHRTAMENDDRVDGSGSSLSIDFLKASGIDGNDAKPPGYKPL